MIFPGLAIFITVMAFNLFGDGLRDALDPTTADKPSPEALTTDHDREALTV